MSFGQLPDLPITPIVGRKSSRFNLNETRSDRLPYFSTPIVGIRYPVRKDGPVFSGSSGASLSRSKKSVESPQAQNVVPSGTVIPPSRRNEASKSSAIPLSSAPSRNVTAKTSSSGRSSNLSGAVVEGAGPGKTGKKVGDFAAVVKSVSKGSETKSKAGKIAEKKQESGKRLTTDENVIENAPKQPRLFLCPQSKNVLQSVQNVGREGQGRPGQVPELASGKDLSGSFHRPENANRQKSSQSSNPSSVKASTGGKTVSRESKTASEIATSGKNSSKTSLSSKQSSNTKTSSRNPAVNSSDETNTKISGSERALEICTTRPSVTAGKRPIKKSDKNPSTGRANKTAKTSSAGSDRRHFVNNRSDSVYDLNSTSESARQIVRQHLSVSQSRKRQIEESLRQDSVSDKNKRRKTGPKQPSSDTGKSSKQGRRGTAKSPLVEICVKPKAYGRWKGVTKPALEFISKMITLAFIEHFEEVSEVDAPEFVRCFEDLEKRINDEINGIKVPPSKSSTNYLNLADTENCLQDDVDEMADSIVHVSKLVDRMRMSVQNLSVQQTTLSD